MKLRINSLIFFVFYIQFIFVFSSVSAGALESRIDAVRLVLEKSLFSKEKNRVYFDFNKASDEEYLCDALNLFFINGVGCWRKKSLVQLEYPLFDNLFLNEVVVEKYVCFLEKKYIENLYSEDYLVEVVDGLRGVCDFVSKSFGKFDYNNLLTYEDIMGLVLGFIKPLYPEMDGVVINENLIMENLKESSSFEFDDCGLSNFLHKECVLPSNLNMHKSYLAESLANILSQKGECGLARELLFLRSACFAKRAFFVLSKIAVHNESKMVIDEHLSSKSSSIGYWHQARPTPHSCRDSNIAISALLIDMKNFIYNIICHDPKYKSSCKYLCPMVVSFFNQCKPYPDSDDLGFAGLFIMSKHSLSELLHDYKRICDLAANQDFITDKDLCDFSGKVDQILSYLFEALIGKIGLIEMGEFKNVLLDYDLDWMNKFLMNIDLRHDFVCRVMLLSEERFYCCIVDYLLKDRSKKKIVNIEDLFSNFFFVLKMIELRKGYYQEKTRAYPALLPMQVLLNAARPPAKDFQQYGCNQFYRDGRGNFFAIIPSKRPSIR